MKRIPLLALVLIVFVTAACGGTVPAGTPDTQATINAAVAATAVQTTIEAAVAATAVAQATDAAPEATPIPAADYSDKGEEELAELGEEAVSEAEEGAEESASAAEEAAADGEITQEELESLEAAVAEAEAAIVYAEQLLVAYDDLYGELATESLDALLAMEDDLALLAEDVAEMTALLVEIDDTLSQGLALAEETLSQLAAASESLNSLAGQLQGHADGWLESVSAQIASRAAAALAVPPSQIASDRQGAILSAFDYVDAVRGALEDSSISPGELADIAQLGANASASLDAQGGPQLRRLSGSVNEITGQLAGGQVPQARAGLGNLEGGLGQRP